MTDPRWMTVRGPDHFTGLSRQPSPGKSLTRREVTVLAFIAEGLTDEQIGRKVGLTRSTISATTKRVLRKLDVPSRAAAVDRGWRKGYLGKDDA